MLGMAVGTGNIWRFPRIAAKNGGGEFLIAWVVFLLLWSIPLILLEFGMGRRLRCGPVKAFVKMCGPRWAWMGAFAVLVTCGITFYYSVVAGWTVRFALATVSGELPDQRLGAFWESYSTSWWPALTHAFTIGICTVVVARGVGSIERVAKVLMPMLIVLVLVLTVRALTLPGAGEGLGYLFGVDWSALGKPQLWIEALAQNAWDTGAGFGMVLCYAAYQPDRGDTTQNAVILPTANNAISLTAGVMVLCTVFSVVPGLAAGIEQNPEALAAYPELATALEGGAALTPELVRETIFSQNNEGLTFVWMPQLFGQLPGGRFLMLLFFAALSFAALTSLMSMVEFGARALVDAGVPRQRAVRLFGSGAFLLGLPSVASMNLLRNQDWVWGVSLMIAGLFFALAVTFHGVRSFREQELNHEDSKLYIGRWWDVVISVLVPLQALVLLVWWMVDSWRADPEGWWRPFAVANVGTFLFQVGIAFAVLIAANRWIAGRVQGSEPGEAKA